MVDRRASDFRCWDFRSAGLHQGAERRPSCSIERAPVSVAAPRRPRLRPGAGSENTDLIFMIELGLLIESGIHGELLAQMAALTAQYRAPIRSRCRLP